MGDYYSSDEERYYYDDDDDRDASDGLPDLETEVLLPCTKSPSSEVKLKLKCSFDFCVSVFTNKSFIFLYYHFLWLRNYNEVYGTNNENPEKKNPFFLGVDKTIMRNLMKKKSFFFWVISRIFVWDNCVMLCCGLI